MSDSQSLAPVAIIGGGPAGLTAALYAARASLSPVVFAGTTPGGQLMLTSEVENFPGFPAGIQGPVLMQQMRAQAERFGARIIDENVESIAVDSRPFKIHSASADISAQSVIIATGAASRWLDLPNEQRLIGHGVSSCATCDGFFFKGKKVAVVGGGDAAMEEALFLTKFAAHVTVVHRRDAFRASKIMSDKVLAHPNIDVRWNRGVADVLGSDHVTGLSLVTTDADGNVATTDVKPQETIDVDGVFVAIGHVPATSLFKGHVDLDAKGYVLAHDRTRTSVEGIFTAGDVHDAHYRQAITAAGFGCMAALDAERYLRLGEV